MEMNWKAIIKGGPEREAESRVLEKLEQGISATATSRFQKTLLHAAAIADNLPIARLAIARGVNVNARAYPCGKGARMEKITMRWTALSYAIRNGNFEMVRLLLDNGAIETTSAQNETPMGLALRYQVESVFWVLVEYGLTSNYSWASGCAPEIGGGQLARMDQPFQLIRSNEKFLMESHGLDYLQVKASKYCSRCTSELESEDATVKILWREREARVARLKPIESAFTYGYLRRCGLCRTSLNNMQTKIDYKLSWNRKTILPSYARSFNEIQSRNCEEDLIHLLQIHDRTRHDDTDSDSSFLLPSYWLLRCLKSHHDCSIQQELVNLPTRLIEVGGFGYGEVSRVVESPAGQPGTYCTLSYRWSSNPLVLTSDTLASFKDELPIQELPKTIQQAMYIAGKLGFQYLWVDALCILQDSSEDWEVESSKMGDIYRNSTLTIAAIDASEDQGGIFTRRTRKPGNTLRPKGVLDTRGWTVQEQLLSRRILSFTNSGIFWTCAKWHCSEEYPAGIDVLRTTVGTKDQVLDCAFTTRPRQSWMDIIKDYTSRNLTQESDRLVAIKGIASYHAMQLNDPVFAGISRSDFNVQLSWVPNLQQASLISYDLLNAPSWSWGSVKGPITFIIGDSHLAKVELIDIQASDHGHGRYSGSITLKGTLLPVILEGDTISFIPEPSASASTIDGAPRPKRFIPDFPTDQSFLADFQSGGIFLPDRPLLVEGKIYVLHVGRYGLCLVPDTSQVTQFRRIGVCEWKFDVRALACEFGSEVSQSLPEHEASSTQIVKII